MKSVKDEGLITQLAVVATMMPKVKEYIDQQADRIAELEKALDWIATVNAMDYEYQDVAKSLLKERHGIK